MTVERIARTVELDIIRQLDRQIGARHRIDAASLAMDHRDRAAPIALAGNAPVAQAELHLAACLRTIAERGVFEAVRHFIECGFRRKPVEEARIDHHAIVGIGRLANAEACRILALRQNDRRDLQFVLVGEIQIALIVRRTAENGARAIFHQDEIGDIDRQFPVLVERMPDLHASIKALLLGRF